MFGVWCLVSVSVSGRLSCLSCLLLLLVLLLQLLLLVHPFYLHHEALEKVAKGSGVISFSSRFLQRRHGQRRSPQLGRARQEPRTSHADGPLQIEAPAATQLHWCCCDFVGHVRSHSAHHHSCGAEPPPVPSAAPPVHPAMGCPLDIYTEAARCGGGGGFYVPSDSTCVCHSCRRVFVIQKKEHTRACRLD